MSDFLFKLESLPLSLWIQSSDWGYPILLTFHSLGLGLLVGLLLVMDLRLLGYLKPLPLSGLSKFMPWVWVGFTANAISGVMLFMADATKDYYANSFRIKMACIVIAVTIAVYINKTVLRKGGDAPITTPAKALAWVSIASWAGAIIAGRLIAYLAQV